MTKKILTIALICLLCLCLFTACSPKVEEEILPEQTIMISTVAQLVGMQDYTGKKYSNFTFILENDIDLSNIDVWEPIGKDITTAFMGKFDGKGYKISNLTLKGWDDNGEPLFIGKDTEVINETSYCSIGLFGYTKNTEISNLTLNEVNIYYYTEGTASYTASLVGCDVGSSKFSNIDTNGSIKLSNIYTGVKTYDNKGVEQGLKETCSTVQYMAGVVAYSSGSSEFTNLSSSVIIQNAIYKAIYKEADEEKNIKQGYNIKTSDEKSVLPEQAFAGGVLGLHRGSIINDINSTAQLKIKAKSSYIGGAIAALYSASAKNINVNDVNICSKVTTKNTVGGAIALLDHSNFFDSQVSRVKIDEQCQASEVQSSSVGGAVGYAFDGSLIENIAIFDLTVLSEYNKSILGGILGVIRDSTLNNCTIEEGKYTANSLNKNDSLDDYDKFFVSCGTIAGSIYGNSKVANCTGEVKNHLVYYTYEDNVEILVNKYVSNTIAYATKDSTTYVNEDGYNAIRLFKEGSLSEYIVAYATYNAGILNVIYYTEESKILNEQTYNDVALISGSDSDSVKYMNTFFTQGEGIKDANGENIAFEGRNVAMYAHLSGIPNIDDATLRVKVIK